MYYCIKYKAIQIDTNSEILKNDCSCIVTVRDVRTIFKNHISILKIK